MKYVVLIGDGIADVPLEILDNKTPLEMADLKYINEIAHYGTIGMVKNVPDGFPAGSDVACLSIFGYQPEKFYTGRGPIESAGLEINIEGDVDIYRCNLVTIQEDTLVDYSSGHISSEEAQELIITLNELLGEKDVVFHTGKSYRHILVLNENNGIATTTPPHDIIGEKWQKYLPCGNSADRLKELIYRSKEVLSNHKININREKNGKRLANMIWPWGGGKKIKFPFFKDVYGLEGAVISAVDLIKGLGKLTGLKIINVVGATGFIDTNFEGKVSESIKALEWADIVFVHLEAPDEMSHLGDVKGKIYAIEMFDKAIVGEILNRLKHDFKVLILADHATPIPLKTHTNSPVPFLIFDGNKESRSDKTFCEKDAMKSGLFIKEGYKLMKFFLTGKL